MATGGRVVIGMDPHKGPVTIEVMTADEEVLGGGRFGTDVDGFAAMVGYVQQWPERVWAIEGCNGIGRHVAMRLLAEGQDVVDVPPELSARAGVFSTGQGRKTDATDAHSVALVGTRMSRLARWSLTTNSRCSGLLVDRRRALGEEHTRKVSQLHALLLELIPGGAKKDLSAAQAKALLAHVRPRDLVGKTRRRLAAELVKDLEQNYAAARTPTRNSERSSLRPAPACSTCTASAALARPGCWSRSATSPGSPAATTSPPGPAPHLSTPPPMTTSGTG